VHVLIAHSVCQQEWGSWESRGGSVVGDLVCVDWEWGELLGFLQRQGAADNFIILAPG